MARAFILRGGADVLAYRATPQKSFVIATRHPDHAHTSARAGDRPVTVPPALQRPAAQNEGVM
jgi:hypothetical protein